MRHRMFWRPLAIAVATVAAGALSVTAAQARPAAPTAKTVVRTVTARAAATAAKPECADAVGLMCAEVNDYHSAFGYYVGHDEPSVLYYSNVPGSGNRMRYEFTLPREPLPKVVSGRSWTFQLTPAIWFGMALCDTQSYPLQVSTCTPDSDSNITSNANLAQHAGTAFMELQFYPPGFVKQFAGSSCDARDWCAAMTIDSLSQDPVNGTNLNPTCQSQILGGEEYVNFAFLTKSGKPIGPPNPLDFNATSGNPTRAAGVLFMRQGDRLSVTLHDTPNGLQTVVDDLSTGQTGLMTASAANGFGQIQYAPTGTSCNVLPYTFHPMYSTSSPQTRVPWAAHSYNVAFDEETGHFDYCTTVDTNTGNCTGQEGATGDLEPTDADDNGCFTAAQSLLMQVNGCYGTNTGFDGTSYLPDWPNGNLRLQPSPALFTSPLTGRGYTINYAQAAFETDLPRIEAPDLGGVCNRVSGAGCTLIPPTDDGQPANFYPFFSITGHHNGDCQWFLGNDVPGLTANDFGQNSQYGALYPQTYLVFGGHGSTQQIIDDFHQTLAGNPCPAESH